LLPLIVHFLQNGKHLAGKLYYCAWITRSIDEEETESNRANRFVVYVNVTMDIKGK